MRNLSKDENVQNIEEFFKVPERVADKIKNIAEKVQGGYVLFETRPQWDGSSGPWTKTPVAKIVFHKPSQNWKIYWMRSSGKWEFYGQYKTFKNVLMAIKKDKLGCFWG